MPNIQIIGFGSNDRVPGVYGEVVYGVGGQSAASIPLILLLVGLKGSGGTLTVDTEVRQVFSKTDVDAACTVGSELACMGYDVFDTPGASSVPVFICAPSPAGGAVAATCTITISGTWTANGTITVRIAGKPVSSTISSTDTATTAAASLVAQINGAYQGRLPVTASNVNGVVTLTCKTAGIRGNQHIVFVDLSAAPSGFAAALAGGTAVTGGGVPLSGGTGVETYTNLLATLANSTYDTIAVACNDATSLAAWKSQIDLLAAAPNNQLQHVVTSTNGTISAAQSLSQTTLNHARFQLVWQLNSETHPSRTAAAMAALRTMTEQGDPDAAYDGIELATVIPQAQKADWPSHATLVAAINSGVTPLNTVGDGNALVVRSITTKCLTGGVPDYSTIDTGMARVPDFIFKDLKALWATSFQPNNPRVQADPLPNEPLPAPGIAYPQLWGAQCWNKLVNYSQGILSGTQATVAPIILAPQQGDVVGTFDNVAKRIMEAVTSRPAPANHQLGQSIRQAA